MVVSVFVVADDAFLDALRSYVQGDMDESVFASGGGEDAQFDGIEGISGVAACHVCKEVEGVFIYPGFIVSHSFCFVVDCTEEEFLDFRNLQGFQLEDDGTGEQRGVDFEVWILCCGTDEDDGSVFYEWQKIVLLAFVEAVDLVDEEDCFFAVHTQVLLGFFDNGFHIFFACYSGVDLGEFGTGSVGDDFGQSGLACSRRAVEDDGGQFVSFDSPV